MSGALQAMFMNQRSFGIGGWVATISQTVPNNSNAFNYVISGGKLYIGVQNANSVSSPGGLIRLTPTTPSIDYSTWYLRNVGTTPDTLSSIYETGGSIYGNFTTNSGSACLFVKYNASTGALTTQVLGSGFNNGASAGPITSDSSGNLFTSFKAANGDQGQIILSITKFNSSLAAQWGFTFVNPRNYEDSYGNQEGRVAVTDSSGNIYVGGQLSSSGDSSPAGYAGLIKLNTSGTNQWIRGYGATGSGATQTSPMTAITINGSGNLLISTSISDTTTGIYIFEIDPATGAYTGVKKTITFSTNTASYGTYKSVFDAAGNFYITMRASGTEIWIAKVNAALTSVTVIKLSRSTAGNTSAVNLNTDGTDLYFTILNPTTTGFVYFKIPATLTPAIGTSARLGSDVYSFSAATGTIANNTFANNPTVTLTKNTGMNSWSAGDLTASSKSPAITRASF
jgi:hypothetical protein